MGAWLKVPTLRRDIGRVELDGEVVLHDPVTGGLFRLDRVGALVVGLLDGEVDNERLVADLAGAFDAPVEQVHQDVDQLLTSLAEASLLAGPTVPAPPLQDDPGSATDSTAAPRYVADPPAPCGATDTMVWTPAFAVDLGGVRAGIRANTVDVADGLRAILAGQVVDAADTPPPSYSVHLSPRPGGLHLLYRDKCLQVRSSDPERVLRALLRHLGAHAGGSPGPVAVEAIGVVGPSGATLMPVGWATSLAVLRRRLAAVGVRAAETPFSRLDLDRAELAVGPDLPGDEGALARLVAAAPARRADPILPTGRYPVHRWLFGGFGVVEAESCSRAVATVQAARTVRGPLHLAGADPLGGLGRLFSVARAELVPVLGDNRFATIVGRDAPTGRGR